MLENMRKWIFLGVLTVLCIALFAYFIVCYSPIFVYGPEAVKGAMRFRALDAALKSAPYLSDFVRLFPGAEVNYRYFTRSDEPGFDVAVNLYGRYELEMQLPAHFDSRRFAVIGYGEPKFCLLEVANYKGGETTYNPAGAVTFGSSAWRKIVESEGDFGAIGYSMITNQPVAGFKDRRKADQ